jgi:nucleoside-diphosphate-sugar epimerase
MILLTGGTGLVGAHILLQLCIENKEVKALKRKDSNLKVVRNVFKHYQKKELFEKIYWVNGDILDLVSLEDAIEDCDEVIHSAALVSYQAKDAQQLMKVNVEGTANLINTALQQKINKFGYLSSISTLEKNNGKLISESNHWKTDLNKTAYAKSKHLAEQEVWRGHAEGLDVVIINPSVILGPGNWAKGSSQMFQKVDKGLKYFSPGGTGYVDVCDVVKSLIFLMENDYLNERYIINSENLKYRDLFNWISESLDKPKPSIEVTPFIKEVAWRVESIRSFFSGKAPLITKETARQAMSTSLYDNSKIKQLGIEFTPIKQSVKKYCNWYIDDNY